MSTGSPSVVAVHAGASHGPHKEPREAIRVVAGWGVEGDAHAGVTVQHRSRVAKDPTQPNLRQIHLIHLELYEELRAAGFGISPGRIGENVTTSGLELLELPTRTRLRLGATALVELTGLRNPCVQLDGIQPGLMEATLDRAPDGGLIRKAGVMAVALEGGDVRPGDAIEVYAPDGPHLALRPV